MSGWMADMADAVDKQEAAQAPPQSKAPMPGVSIEDAPTEPATSPRVIEVPVPRYVEELRLPTREDGPQEEPEKFVSRWVCNDGSYTPEEWEEYFRKHRQAFANFDMERQRQQAAEEEHEAHQRSIQEWEAKVQAQGLSDHQAIPRGPPPAGISSMRVLPQVHEALRQNDPSMAPRSQPVLKKAPPTSGRPMPSVFHSDVEPPRIGTQVQPPPPAAGRPAEAQGLNLPLAATPMTPGHPPRPPIEALPKHPSMETGSLAIKHPLEQPAAQGPPNKHVRPKAFPYASHPQDQVSMAASAAVEMPQPNRPCPKGPPADYMPTPPEVASMKTGPSDSDRRSRMNEDGKLVKVKSVLDIDWQRPLWEQLAPVLKGGPSPSKSHAELCELRAKVPELTNHLLEGIFPADNVITAVQTSHGVHKIYMREVAAWVLNGTHWFSLLQQPMMIIVLCHNWEDAAKFQYLMQILQAHYGDFVPRYQIFMWDDSKIYGCIPQWQEPTTIWDGKPVLGFMAETFLDDLSVIGFKDFNPMWTFPTTSVNQCWEPMTFGMPPWHLSDEVDVDRQKSKEALQSQSPIAAFKACNMIQALGIAYSKIVLPSGDSAGESKSKTYCPTTWRHCYQWAYSSQYADQLSQAQASPLLCKECTLLARIQLSKKSASHPDCAFADCASTTMCSAMINLTPCIAPTVTRDCDLDASVSFKDVNDMIKYCNTILSIPHGFPQIPTPRKDCHTFYAKSDERHKQMAICPEQDCEWLVYMSDQDASMVEALGVQDHPLWKQRVQEYKEWQEKNNKRYKSSKEAWTWEGSSSSKWSTTSTRGSSKRGQSVPVDLSKRTNPEEKSLAWRELDEVDTSLKFLFPDTSLPCPIEKSIPLPPEHQAIYINWIVRSFDLDHRVDKDPRVYCAYCDMNNHLRFACKHVAKHRIENERHHCTLCASRHPPFLCPLAQVNGGPGKPNWFKNEYKRAKSENREADYRWGSMITHVDVDGWDPSMSCKRAFFLEPLYQTKRSFFVIPFPRVQNCGC